MSWNPHCYFPQATQIFLTFLSKSAQRLLVSLYLNFKSLRFHSFFTNVQKQSHGNAKNQIVSILTVTLLSHETSMTAHHRMKQMKSIVYHIPHIHTLHVPETLEYPIPWTTATLENAEDPVLPKELQNTCSTVSFSYIEIPSGSHLVQGLLKFCRKPI